MNIDIVVIKEKVDVSGEVNIFWVRIEIELLFESVVLLLKDVYLCGELDREELLDIVYVLVLVNIDKNKIEEVKFEVFGFIVSLYGGICVNI